MDFSKSLARRRFRPSHAKVRSTTHRRGSSTKPFAVSDRLMISIVHVPHALKASLSLSPALRLPARQALRMNCTAIGKDMAQPREAVTDFLENVARAIKILNIGGMNDGGDEKTWRVGEDMTLASFGSAFG